MKAADLIITISENGDILVNVNGTQGSECLDLMSFLDMVPGLIVEETVSTDDMQTKNVQTVGKQQVGK